MLRFAQHDNYLNPIQASTASNVQANHEQSTNNRQSGKSAASKNYEKRSDIIRDPGWFGRERPGGDGNSGLCHVPFERGCCNLPIHRATEARSIRCILSGSAACSGCLTHRATGLGNEILNTLAICRNNTGRPAAPSDEDFGVAGLPLAAICASHGVEFYVRDMGSDSRI